jgi:hypothetical protein
VAVHVVLDPAATDLGSHVTTVCVSAGFIVVGLKFAVIVPKSFTVAVVDANDGSANVMADASLTVQPVNA